MGLQQTFSCDGLRERSSSEAPYPRFKMATDTRYRLISLQRNEVTCPQKGQSRRARSSALRSIQRLSPATTRVAHHSHRAHFAATERGASDCMTGTSYARIGHFPL